MQYVACKFRSTDTRTYTYINDGAPVAIGDKVKVADSRSDNTKTVEVVEITDRAPPFACKPILGLAEPKQPDLIADGDDADLEATLENLK